MAILKYQNKDGQLITVNSYKINNVIVSQEKGQSTADVMSQKAVTDEITAINEVVNDKANSKDVYTKSESDTKYQIKGNYISYVESANHKGYYEPNLDLVIDCGEY